MIETPLRPATQGPGPAVESAAESAAENAAKSAAARTRKTVENPAEPASKRVRWPWIAGGLVVMAGLGPTAYAMNLEDPPPASVAEGAFAVTVTGTECGVTEVGPVDLRQTAAGQYCLVKVQVRNDGTEPALLDSGAQRAIDSTGRDHPVADNAVVFLNDRTPSLLDEIPAGHSVEGVLPFDVPAGADLSALTVHESMTSKGVRLLL